MLDTFAMFWTMLSNLLSGLNRLCKSFDDVASVVEVNASNFAEQERLEATHKTKELKDKLSAVA